MLLRFSVQKCSCCSFTSRSMYQTIAVSTLTFKASGCLIPRVPEAFSPVRPTLSNTWSRPQESWAFLCTTPRRLLNFGVFSSTKVVDVRPAGPPARRRRLTGYYARRGASPAIIPDEVRHGQSLYTRSAPSQSRNIPDNLPDLPVPRIRRPPSGLAPSLASVLRAIRRLCSGRRSLHPSPSRRAGHST